MPIRVRVNSFFGSVQLVKKIDELEEQSADGKKQLPKLEASLEKQRTKLEEEESKLDGIFESVKGKTEHLRLEMESKQKELIPLRSKTNEIQQKVDVAAAEFKLCKFSVKWGCCWLLLSFVF